MSEWICSAAIGVAQRYSYVSRLRWISEEVARTDCYCIRTMPFHTTALCESSRATRDAECSFEMQADIRYDAALSPGAGDGEDNIIVSGDVPEGKQRTGKAAVANEVRITTPYMTKYERARVLGTRALQIS